MKNPIYMIVNGWCDDCDGDPAQCYKEGKCLGYIGDSEKEDEDEGKTSV